MKLSVANPRYRGPANIAEHRKAIAPRSPHATAFHSDRGTRFRSTQVTRLLATNGLPGSIGRVDVTAPRDDSLWPVLRPSRQPPRRQKPLRIPSGNRIGATRQQRPETSRQTRCRPMVNPLDQTSPKTYRLTAFARALPIVGSNRSTVELLPAQVHAIANTPRIAKPRPEPPLKTALAGPGFQPAAWPEAQLAGPSDGPARDSLTTPSRCPPADFLRPESG